MSNKVRIVICLVVGFTLLTACGCSEHSAETLNQALTALQEQQTGQLRIFNVNVEKESLSAEIAYAFEDGMPTFTHRGWNAEGEKSEYQYQDGKLIIPEGDLPETTIENTTQYRTLSEIAGVDIMPIQQGEIQTMDCQLLQDGTQVYTVEMKQSDVREEEPYASVWAPKYRRYVVKEGRLAELEVGDSQTYTMKIQFL